MRLQNYTFSPTNPNSFLSNHRLSKNAQKSVIDPFSHFMNHFRGKFTQFMNHFHPNFTHFMKIIGKPFTKNVGNSIQNEFCMTNPEEFADDL